MNFENGHISPFNITAALPATFQLYAEFGKMFPWKEDLFLRKWEGHIVPKQLKVATLKDPNVLPAGEERDGTFPSMYIR